MAIVIHTYVSCIATRGAYDFDMRVINTQTAGASEPRSRTDQGVVGIFAPKIGINNLLPYVTHITDQVCYGSYGLLTSIVSNHYVNGERSKV